jgi:hypothetical protein
MRKYPIGLQNFVEIRNGGYIYIDKTQLIHKLIESGKYYFLSRPRRFGKSLLLSTIKEIFNGNKEQFEDLWIYDQWNWEQKYPVIHIRFSQIAYKELGLTTAISRELDFIAKEFGIQLVEYSLALKFRELIREVAKIGQVVILIDEYDKPITDYLEDLEKVEENRSVFKSFYSVLKDADEYIRLLLITGVSRFPKVSIFSDLNNLNDITIHRNYATIAGITQQELEKTFAEEIADIQQQQPDLLSKLKLWYNGYAWHEDAERVYNPFSVLKYMDGRDFRNYWFHTGTPTWLVNLMKQNREFDLENIHIGENALSSFNVEHIAVIPVLFQTGYLSIKGYNPDKRLYELGYPNTEVEESLTDALLSAYRNIDARKKIAIGISFSSEKRGVGELLIKEIE